MRKNFKCFTLLVVVFTELEIVNGTSITGEQSTAPNETFLKRGELHGMQSSD
jgi:hypothetical protein